MILWPVTEFSVIMVGNVGSTILNALFPSAFNSYFNHYKYDLQLDSPLNGQDTKAHLNIDFANVEAPYIENDYIQFSL